MKKIIFLLLFLLVSYATTCNAQTGVITHFAGTHGSVGYGGDGGPATAAVLGTGYKSIACDAVGNIYISDYGRLRKVDASGIITTIAGTGTPGHSGDGGPATAAQIFGGWVGLVIDAAGNIYFGDSLRIRKINSAGIITTVAGNGTLWFNGDGIPATAAAVAESGILIDHSGNLIVCDATNTRVRKINSAGIITTIASSAASYPIMDAIGNIYFSEAPYLIKKLDTFGVITPVAGSLPGYSGDGGPATAAEINQAYGLSMDRLGNLYFADEGSNRVRVVSSSGVINTVAGSGPLGAIAYGGDGGAATAAQLYAPISTAVDPAGNLYVSDNGNNVVRRITIPSLTVAQTANEFEPSIFPNPVASELIIKNAKGASFYIKDMFGREVYTTTIQSDWQQINIATLPSGIYFGEAIIGNGLEKITRIVKQ